RRYGRACRCDQNAARQTSRGVSRCAGHILTQRCRHARAAGRHGPADRRAPAMTRPGWFRGVVVAAGLMGAAGVVLAAVAAHKTGGAILLSASSMLLFHAPAALLT